MPPARTAILQLYNDLAQHIPLDLITDTPHMPGCDGTLRRTYEWIAIAANAHYSTWQTWLQEMCIDCDCALLLQLSTMSTEHGALEGINTRRCPACNRLLVFYQVMRTPAAPDLDLLTWAAESEVPAYVITLAQAHVPHQARVRKVYPAGAVFVLTAQRFYESVLQNLEMQHRCQHP